jgi:hypothetical protein
VVSFARPIAASDTTGGFFEASQVNVARDLVGVSVLALVRLVLLYRRRGAWVPLLGRG